MENVKEKATKKKWSWRKIALLSAAALGIAATGAYIGKRGVKGVGEDFKSLAGKFKKSSAPVAEVTNDIATPSEVAEPNKPCVEEQAKAYNNNGGNGYRHHYNNNRPRWEAKGNYERKEVLS